MQYVLALLAPILDQLIMLAGGILLGVGTWAAKRAADWLKLSNDARVRAYLLGVVETAVGWAQDEAARRLQLARAKELTGEPARAPDAAAASAVELAAGYVAARVPDALKHFGITPDGLRQIVQTRLSGA